MRRTLNAAEHAHADRVQSANGAVRREIMVLMTYPHGVYTANDTSGCLEVMLNRHENVEFRGDYNMYVMQNGGCNTASLMTGC